MQKLRETGRMGEDRKANGVRGVAKETKIQNLDLDFSRGDSYPDNFRGRGKVYFWRL